MSHSSEGDVDAQREFYKLLTTQKLFVPKRRQSRPLSDSPDYPNELIDILGVQGKDRIVVPVFSNPELIEAWSGVPFEYRALTLLDLKAIVPEGWLIVLNPGQEVEKEITPWELSRLLEGGSAVDEVLEDLGADGNRDGFKVEGVDPHEFPKLFEVARNFFEEETEIDSIYWVKEHRLTRVGVPEVALLLALEAGSRSTDIAPLQKKFRRIIERAMIGDLPFRVLESDAAGESFQRQVMSHYPPLAQRTDLWSRLRRMLRDRRSRA